MKGLQMRFSKGLGWIGTGMLVVGVVSGLSGCSMTPQVNGEASVDRSFEAGRATPLGIVVTDEGGRVPQGGATEIETSCLQALMSKNYELVERAKLSSLVISELRFQQSGLTDADAVQLGKLTNAKAMMLVQVTDLRSVQSGNERSFITFTRERARLTMRIIDVQTGKLMWLASSQGSNSAIGGSEPIELVKKMVTETIAKLPAPGEPATPSLAAAAK